MKRSTPTRPSFPGETDMEATEYLHENVGADEIISYNTLDFTRVFPQF